MIARHPDPQINDLYKERRKQSTKADGSGLPAMRAWSRLEVIEAQLRRLDPEGDWRFEGRGPETNWRWAVRKP